jgi:hypothetical protein
MRTVDQGFPPLKWFLKHVIKKERNVFVTSICLSFFLSYPVLYCLKFWSDGTRFLWVENQHATKSSAGGGSLSYLNAVRLKKAGWQVL